jgi:hypothetical protein
MNRITALRERLKQRFKAAEYDELCRLEADEKAAAAVAHEPETAPPPSPAVSESAASVGRRHGQRAGESAESPSESP